MVSAFRRSPWAQLDWNFTTHAFCLSITAHKSNLLVTAMTIKFGDLFSSDYFNRDNLDVVTAQWTFTCDDVFYVMILRSFH